MNAYKNRTKYKCRNSMEQILLAVAVSVAVFAILFYLMPGLVKKQSVKHTREALQRVQDEVYTLSGQSATDSQSVLKTQAMSKSEPLNEILKLLPGASSTHALLQKAGMSIGVGGYYIITIAVFILFMVLMSYFSLGAFNLPISIVLSIILTRKYLWYRVNKRNEAFLAQFPDAVDMIVRSVRSGHPLNAALRMIVDNADPPVSTEFKKVVDEVAYGRTLTEALLRMSKRIDQPDVNFFVVILSVQQETGGNLAEVLSNLSNILRKRKQLRLKIRALTSEGRITSYILGAIPIFLMLVLHVTSPHYLVPLFEEPIGRMILFFAMSLIVLAVFIVRKMVQIDI